MIRNVITALLLLSAGAVSAQGFDFSKSSYAINEHSDYGHKRAGVIYESSPSQLNTTAVVLFEENLDIDPSNLEIMYTFDEDGKLLRKTENYSKDSILRELTGVLTNACYSYARFLNEPSYRKTMSNTMTVVKSVEALEYDISRGGYHGTRCALSMDITSEVTLPLDQVERSAKALLLLARESKDRYGLLLVSEHYFSRGDIYKAKRLLRESEGLSDLNGADKDLSNFIERRLRRALDRFNE